MSTIEAPQPFIDGDVGNLPVLTRAGVLVGYALVDVEDFDRLSGHLWRVTPDGYPVRRTGPHGAERKHLLHREVLGLPPGGAIRVRHVEGNRLDCRKVSLAVSTRAVARLLRDRPSLAQRLVLEASA